MSDFILKIDAACSNVVAEETTQFLIISTLFAALGYVVLTVAL
jgi:hypothetical protein